MHCRRTESVPELHQRPLSSVRRMRKRNSTPPSRKSYALIGGIVAIVLAGILAYRWLVRDETLLHAANACLDSIEKGDARNLFRYVRVDERRVLSLDEPKLQSLLSTFLLARLQGFTRVGAQRVEIYELGQVLQVTRTYKHSDGREVAVVVGVTPSDDGPKLTSCTEDLLFAGLRTYWPRERQSRPPAVPGAVAYAQALREAMGLLETLPLSGWAVREDSTLYYESWGDTLQHFERLAARVQEARKPIP